MYPVPGTPFGVMEENGNWKPVWAENRFDLTTYRRWSDPLKLAAELVSLWSKLSDDDVAVLKLSADAFVPFDKEKYRELAAVAKSFFQTSDVRLSP